MRFSQMITAVDAHAAGMFGRVVIGGVGALHVPGRTMFEKKRHMEQHQDWFRRLMLREPRGNPAAMVNLVLPPTDASADAGVIIMEQSEYYPSMSGSNVMCVVTVLLECGIVRMEEPSTRLTLETPAGLVSVLAECDGGRVMSVTITNVPAFAVRLDASIEVTGFGTMAVDVSWGGMFYVIADGAALGFRLTPEEGADIVAAGERIRAAAREQIPVAHPENPAINLIEGTLLFAPPHSPDNSGRSAVVVPSPSGRGSRTQGMLDRSPCGTGTSAQLATLHARGRVPLETDFRQEGILDTVFVARALQATRVGPHAAIVPSIRGRAWITGFAQYVLAPDDPFPEGFMVGDIWPL
ncbi:MAG TPA: proline racemase family protein [Vicinamibacterales bacterium]|nr:proline racemase family protein [Vicinamibacterales bacterium]